MSRVATFASWWPCASWSREPSCCSASLGLWFSDALVWPLTLAGLGVALLWARTGEEERARLAHAANRIPGRPFESFVGGWQSALRLGLGAVLVLAGLGAFLAANDALAAARQVAIAVAVAVAGLALILAPWIRRMTTDLAEERRERIRSEERAEMAAHLHDSVLQTLALIQRKADQPRELVALARRQERELRAWLYGGTDRVAGHAVGRDRDDGSRGRGRARRRGRRRVRG